MNNYCFNKNSWIWGKKPICKKQCDSCKAEISERREATQQIIKSLNL